MLDAIALNYAGHLVIAQADQWRYVQTTGYVTVNPLTGAIGRPSLLVDGEPAVASTVPTPSDPMLWLEIRWEVADPRPQLRRMAETTVEHRLDLRGELVFTHAQPVEVSLCVWGPFACETFVWAGPADFNVDGLVDTFDFLAFQNAWTEGSMACDFDRDGGLSVFDFLAYLNQFDAMHRSKTSADTTR